MAEFDVLKEYARMVKPGENGVCTIGCFNCPISGANNGENKDCANFVRLYPEKATEIIRRWAKEHPRKTRGDQVIEHFPDANLDLLYPCNLLGKMWKSKNCFMFVSCEACRRATWHEGVE